MQQMYNNQSINQTKMNNKIGLLFMYFQAGANVKINMRNDRAKRRVRSMNHLKFSNNQELKYDSIVNGQVVIIGNYNGLHLYNNENKKIKLNINNDKFELYYKFIVNEGQIIIYKFSDGEIRSYNFIFNKKGRGYYKKNVQTDMLVYFDHDIINRSEEVYLAVPLRNVNIIEINNEQQYIIFIGYLEETECPVQTVDYIYTICCYYDIKITIYPNGEYSYEIGEDELCEYRTLLYYCIKTYKTPLCN